MTSDIRMLNYDERYYPENMTFNTVLDELDGLYESSSRNKVTHAYWSPLQASSKGSTSRLDNYSPSSSNDKMSLENVWDSGHLNKSMQLSLTNNSETQWSLSCSSPTERTASESFGTPFFSITDRFTGRGSRDLKYAPDASRHVSDDNCWATGHIENDSQSPVTQLHEISSEVQSEVPYPMPMTPVIRPIPEQASPEDIHDSELKNFNEVSDGSHLYVTYDNPEKLRIILTERGLEISAIENTSLHGVLAVLFKTHSSAKHAFCAQKELRIRMVPPAFSIKNWWKNPSPKFRVIFVTRRRVSVRSGKSLANSKLGDFLMTSVGRNSKNQGCYVWVDQMKGVRVRVVAFVGRFKHLDGKIEERKQAIFAEEKEVVGWISTSYSRTKEKLVDRISWNTIDEYVYT